MSENNRIRAASSLRKFFDEQIAHLHHLADRLGSHLPEPAHDAKEDLQIVERFVDESNTKLRAVSGYADKLRQHVRTLYNHVHTVAGLIPEPVNLNLEAFGEEPLVNALFASSNDIAKLFDTDREVDVFCRTHNKYQTPVMYGLLTACKSEKHMLGIGMQGDMLVREVPQQAVNFSAHKLHAPCASMEELNIAMTTYLFDRVVTLLRLEMLSHMPQPGDDSYELRIKSLANPDVYLNTLIEYLAVPSNLLSIDKLHFRLSKLGIKLDADDRQSANEFDIHELTWGNNTRNVILQVSLTR